MKIIMNGNSSSGISSLSLRYVENRYHDEYLIWHTAIYRQSESTFVSSLSSHWELSFISGKPEAENDLDPSLELTTAVHME